MFSLFKKKEKEEAYTNTVTASDDEIVALGNGTLIPIEQVNDPTFAEKMMGDGIAFDLDDGFVVSPCNGSLDVAFPTGHAFGITRNDGVEVLIHIGINTVSENGKGFTVLAKQGTQVKAGDPLVKVDLNTLRTKYDMTTMLVITNPNDKEVSFIDCEHVERGQKISK